MLLIFSYSPLPGSQDRRGSTERIRGNLYTSHSCYSLFSEGRLKVFFFPLKVMKNKLMKRNIIWKQLAFLLVCIDSGLCLLEEKLCSGCAPAQWVRVWQLSHDLPFHRRGVITPCYFMCWPLVLCEFSAPLVCAEPSAGAPVANPCLLHCWVGQNTLHCKQESDWAV